MVRVNDQDTGLAGGRGYALEVGDGIGRFRGFLGPFVKFPAGFEDSFRASTSKSAVWPGGKVSVRDISGLQLGGLAILRTRQV